jgi:hypothetical protein
MPIINICDGCGKRLQVLGKNTLIGKRLTYGVFCDDCFKSIEDFAIRKYKINVEVKDEGWKS